MSQVYSNVIQFYTYIYVFNYIYIYIFFFRLFSIIGYYKILNIIPCSICCLFYFYFLFLKSIYLFIYLAVLGLSCGKWDLPSSLKHMAPL